MTIGDEGTARLQRANDGLARHRYGTPEHEHAYRELLALAEAPGAAWAQWFSWRVLLAGPALRRR